jgi:hypothetical protein
MQLRFGFGPHCSGTSEMLFKTPRFILQLSPDLLLAVGRIELAEISTSAPERRRQN